MSYKHNRTITLPNGNQMQFKSFDNGKILAVIARRTEIINTDRERAITPAFAYKVDYSSVPALARQIYDFMLWDERNNGDMFVRFGNGTPLAFKDIINSNLTQADDTRWEFARKVLGAIADSGNGKYDLQATIDEIEPDIYTSDLTAWLARHIDHVQYITDALGEFGGDFRDGSQLLAMAQALQIQEVGYAILQALEDAVEDHEEESVEDNDENIAELAPDLAPTFPYVRPADTWHYSPDCIYCFYGKAHSDLSHEQSIARNHAASDPNNPTDGE